MAWAASFCVTTSPKRDATWVIKRTRTGPPSSTTPRSTTNRAACVTLFASMPRTAKYPLSEASVEPGRPPNANTCTHESAASGSDRSSPSLRAISAIDLSMMMVESGSSMGSDAKPKAPPAAPEAVAKTLCKRCDPARHLECLGGGGGDRLRGGSGERVSDKLDRLADHIGEPRGKPRMFERGNGGAQRHQVALGHACRIEHRLRSSSAREPGVVRRGGHASSLQRSRSSLGDRPGAANRPEDQGTRSTAMLRSSSISGQPAAAFLRRIKNGTPRLRAGSTRNSAGDDEMAAPDA